MAEPVPMPMCPMAETCKGIMDKPSSGYTLIVPGVVFIALGIAIVFAPIIAVWLVAGAFVLFGVMLLFISSVVRKIGTQSQSVPQGAAKGGTT
jgi:membrane protein implicated in regulation of membrane protease activity